MKQYLDKVREFQSASDQLVNLEPTQISFKEMYLRFELMKEENQEFLSSTNKTEMLDAVVDMLYVLCGSVNSCGLQDVIEEAFDRVHVNNMTKIGADGKVLRNPEGKILKPVGFVSVKLNDLVNEN